MTVGDRLRIMRPASRGAEALLECGHADPQ
jgi:hypothetical protein